jgi:putative Mn2+ efflux pump MntP
MELREVILIGIALAMDALGVSITLGINPILKRRNKIGFIISFAFFQFLFILLGGIGGKFFDTYIVAIPHMICGVVVVLVGIIMILEYFKKDNKDDYILIKKSMYIILGMSVNIDALVVGFTAFHEVYSLLLLTYAILVGLISLIICTTGFFICRYARKVDFICKYSNLLGGLILLALGFKMIFF